MTSFWSRLLRRKERPDLPAVLLQHAGVRKRIDFAGPWAEADLVVFDTELTGLDLKRNSIISIGAVRMRGRRVLVGQTFYRLVRPSSDVKREGVLVHGLRPADLVSADGAAEVLCDFLAFAGDAVLVGHFVDLDRSFVDRALKTSFGVGLKSPVIDTVSVYDFLVENVTAFSKHHGGISLKKDLFSLTEKYGITIEKAHDALYDAYLTAQLLQRFLHFLPSAGVHRVRDLLSVGRP